MQPWHTPCPIWNQSVVPCPVLTVASWPAYRFLKKQVRWSGILISFRIFHSLLLCVCVSVTQLCPALCDPTDCSSSGSSVHGTLQPRRPTGLRALYPTWILVVVVFTHKTVSESCDPTDCSPPGSSVHGILQARTLEWVAISFSMELSKCG